MLYTNSDQHAPKCSQPLSTEPPAGEPFEPKSDKPKSDDPNIDDVDPTQGDEDSYWDAFIPDDDERDPLPEPGDFWIDLEGDIAEVHDGEMTNLAA